MAYAPYSEEDFVEIPGCTSLTDKSISSCTSTELLQNGLVQFRLRERCSIELGSSFWKEILLTTYATNAGHVSDLRIAPRKHHELMLQWTPSTTSCTSAASTFLMWEVRLSQGVDDAYVSHPSGCSCLFNRDVSTCVLTELLSNSRYSYQVKEVCTDDRRSGDYLNVGMATTLFDVAAPPAIALGLKNMSSTWLDIDFVGAVEQVAKKLAASFCTGKWNIDHVTKSESPGKP